MTITSGLFEDGGLTLRNVEWESYEVLNVEEANHHVRMTYLDGTLTIMSPRFRHVTGSRRLLYVINAVATARDIEFMAVGTTTLRREGRAAR